MLRAIEFQDFHILRQFILKWSLTYEFRQLSSPRISYPSFCNIHLLIQVRFFLPWTFLLSYDKRFDVHQVLHSSYYVCSKDKALMQDDDWKLLLIPRLIFSHRDGIDVHQLYLKISKSILEARSVKSFSLTDFQLQDNCFLLHLS